MSKWRMCAKWFLNHFSINAYDRFCLFFQMRQAMKYSVFGRWQNCPLILSSMAMSQLLVLTVRLQMSCVKEDLFH